MTSNGADDWLSTGGLKDRLAAKDKIIEEYEKKLRAAEAADKSCNQTEMQALKTLLANIKDMAKANEQDAECDKERKEAANALLLKTKEQYDNIVTDLSERLRQTHQLLDAAQRESTSGKEREAGSASRIKELQLQLERAAEDKTQALAAAQVASRAKEENLEKEITTLRSQKDNVIATLTQEKSELSNKLAAEAQARTAAASKASEDAEALQKKITELTAQQSRTAEQEKAKNAQIDDLRKAEDMLKQVKAILNCK